jgi:uncharacterized protein (TIGR02099 family)
MSPIRRGLRRLRRWLAFGLAGLVIIAGLCVAVISQLLPLLGAHPERVAAWLSAQAGRPVVLSGVRAAWTRHGPRLELEGLRIGGDGQWLAIGRADLQIHAYAGLLPGRPLSSLELTAPLLELQRSADGNWHLHGLAGRESEAAPPQLRQLDGLGELIVHRASLRLRDESRSIDFSLPHIDARLRASGGRVQLGVHAYRDGEAMPLRLNLAFDRERVQGRGYLGGERMSLRDWRALLPDGLGAAIEGGRASGGLWFAFDAAGPLQAEFALDLAALELASPVPLGPAETVALPPLAGSGRWQRREHGWQLQFDAPVSGGGHGHALLQADGGLLTVEATDWPLEPLGLALANFGRLDDGARQWLLAARPRGWLRGLRSQWQDRRLQRFEGLLQALAVDPVEQVPGFSGLSIAFDGDRDGLSAELAAAPLVVDWPPALRAPEAAQADGRLQLYRAHDAADAAEPGDWVLDITRLRLRGEDYGVDLAGSLQFDGGAPSASLRASVEPGPILAAHRFWIRHLMPEGTVRWLEEAIEDGWIERGQVLVQGDLDDWPFKQQQGRFEAEAIIRDTRLRFHPDWPAAERLTGSARFINDGMRVEAAGQLLDMHAARAVGVIDAFGAAVLELDIAAAGGGPAMLDVLRQSPLQASHGQYFDSLQIGGRGTAELLLSIPLGDEPGEMQLQGQVALRQAELADPRWGVAFAEAEGAIRFTDRGLLARELAVQYDGQPARFSLAVGSFTRYPGHAAEASLAGRLQPRSLLAAQPALEWLQPYLSGPSEWLLELSVPDGEQAGSSLRVRSDMVGTRIALPAPLAKAHAVRMPLDLLLELPAGPLGAAPPSRRLELRLGELLRLYGELSEAGRFDGVAAFGLADTVERPPRGIRVVGQAAVLDLAGWAGLAVARGDGDGLLADLDLRAGEVDLLGRGFSDTRLRFHRSADGGARIEVGGQGLQGSVELPADAERATRGITARFARIHWPTASEEDPADSSLLLAADPGALPPLHVWVGDLRLGAARLGEARLESFPVDGGMRIERFETRSPALELFARGDWTRSGLRQRSTFALDFTAPDLGEMLRALGFETLIEGGATLARLQATWPGAPTAFSLETVDGWLEASVGKGRIPEVEPGGAGRVFGLLSLSEIPRRLALDFSDFFRAGLAFSRIEGRFKLDDGDAITDDLLIEGPAAEIRIRGRTGLKAQDYAQTMEVLPRAGNVLPVVGALAGGPAGAAIGAVAQAVLSRPFKQMSRSLYSVEGSWREPRIELIERGPERVVVEPGMGNGE